MTHRPSRRYHETHRGPEFPLLAVRDRLREEGPLGPSELEELSEEVGLPVATVRGAISFYADLREDPSATRVCRGTSCELAGAGRLIASGDGDDLRTVYCLGQCDRSPAVLRDGDVLHGAAARAALGFGNGGPGDADRTPGGPGTGTGDDYPTSRIRALGVEEPVVTRRIGRGDFSRLPDARDAGVYDALEEALSGPPGAVLEAVERSGARGRGGAGFPTGRKWRTCAEAEGSIRYVVANGDEGDPGSFIDRLLMERDPHALLEGMALCAYAVGARHGIVFVRSEYPRAGERIRSAIADARDAGLLGEGILGSDFSFDVVLYPGMGSYVCGEETAMLNAIEGVRGEVRLRPPYPAEQGLYGQPTVVNNVETLTTMTHVLREGPDAYARLGTPDSTGTKALCLNHGFQRPGVLEVEFGTPLEEVFAEAGFAGDTPPKAVLVGGPMGSVLTPDAWDVPICFAAMRRRDLELGHGSLVAVPEDASYLDLLAHRLRFMADESCGRCVPCSRGSRAALRAVERGTTDTGRGDSTPDPESRERVESLFRLMEETSLCAFGTSMPPGLRRLLELAADEEAGP